MLSIAGRRSGLGFGSDQLQVLEFAVGNVKRGSGPLGSGADLLGSVSLLTELSYRAAKTSIQGRSDIRDTRGVGL
jgi:hypothetical protein